MHRFTRKRSDSKRGQAPATRAGPLQEEQERDQEITLSPLQSPAAVTSGATGQEPQLQQQEQEDPSTNTSSPPEQFLGFLPSLPPTSDFRASVILPDLSRRFSLLRQGEQATFDHLKNRFAEQRARGAVHQITEEEEGMLLDALGRFRSRGSTTTTKSQENINAEGEQDRDNLSVTSAPTSDVTSSPSSGRSKRYSNNLFGSGRLRDYTYLRSASARSRASSARTTSLTPSESSAATVGRMMSVAESTSASSLRPETPEGTITSSMASVVSSVQASPDPQQQQSVDTGSVAASSTSNVSSDSDGVGESSSTLNAISMSASSAIPTASVVEYKLAKTMDPTALKRASLALQEAIKELEDETEDEIVLPRSQPVPRVAVDQAGHVSETRNSFSSFEAGVAVTADRQVHASPDERQASPLPSRILGYIPGMPRPMTPRDFDLDDRSHSTTPRATSPIMIALADSSSPPSSGAAAAVTGLLRKESISSSTVKQSPRPSTPLFLQRSPSTTGRQTPDEGARRGEPIEFESPLSSTLLARRRPISPLSNLAATAITATASTGTTGNSSSSSRPSTPSNVIWQPSLSGGLGALKGSAHTRNESWTSSTSDTGSELSGTIDRHKAPRGNLRSPEPHATGSIGVNNPGASGSGGVGTSSPDRPQAPTNVLSAGNGGDVFSSNRSQRSPTPTQNTPRSPSSPAFGFSMDRNGSRRSSRQNAPSPWGFGGSYSAMFNPFPNSSRSSIESTGSSYHSWEGDKDRDWYEHILGGEEPQPVWHDLSAERTDSPPPDDQLEEQLRKYFGLTSADFVAIQEKLVSIANAKAASGEMTRKRRPSTSQSNYVPTRVASPPPHAVQAPASPASAATLTPEYNKKASALLNSVVSDIQSKQPPPLDTTGPAVQTPSRSEPSPGTRRNRDLAQVLFGDEGTGGKSYKPEPSPVSTPAPPNNTATSNTKRVATPEPKLHPPDTKPSAPLTATQSPYQLTRNPSSTRIPSAPKSEAELAKEIQLKTEAATAALKSASRNHLPGDGLAHSGSISRRRIDPSQISTPRLVSASTSVDTIPLRSPSLSGNNSSGASKIGSRFKKLRGSLRAKNPPPLLEEITPYPLSSTSSSRTPMSAQTANYDPAILRAPGSPALASATESGRFKVPVPSPPASAGPGLKGFISRFRNKQRATGPPGPEGRLSPQLLSHAPPLSSLSAWHQDLSDQPTPTNDTGSKSLAAKPADASQAAIPSPAMESSTTAAHNATPPSGSHQSVMIQQLFDAAGSLGLDQSALNDLLMRSGSISTRATKLARGNSQAARSTSRLGQRSETPTAIEQSSSGDQSTIQPPSPVTSRPSPSQLTPEEGGTRPLTLRPDNVRRARENRGDQAASTIVRRTIILPGGAGAAGFDIQNGLQRTNSGKRQRRGSVNSGSIKDRAPTPPPPRSPVGQRFSNDGSPPVPSLPQALVHPDALNIPPGGNIEKSNSTYDSLYDMYAGESRVASAMSIDPNSTESPQGASESGPALQFIEYANGDTIWSIVNGLRDDDNESIYTTGRASFASEYSSREDWDNMQVVVKEHTRSSSKGSYSSFAFKNKKPAGSPSRSRPETKVFYSSSTKIGRLIENLSQGMDSGSFNIVPNSRPGHSASSSLSTNDINWTVEERLEHMLGSINRSS